jgi:hypothetical protein
MRIFLASLLLFCRLASAQPLSLADPVMGSSTSGGLDSRVTGWVARVVANGGATPSVGTQNALNTFVLGMDASGIWSSMTVVNIMAPDSLIACMTPLLVGGGSDPWSNTGLTGGAVTVNGLKGDGTHYLNTGFNGSTLSANSAGMSLYIYTPGTGTVVMGQENGSSPVFLLSGSTFACWDNSASTSMLIDSPAAAGFHSGSRTGANASSIYYGSSLNNVFSVASTTTASSGNNSTFGFPIYVMADNHSNLTPLFISTGTCSFSAIHAGLTALQTSQLFTNVQALRIALGGGYSDPVTDWANRVVANGGAAPGNTTLNALTNFIAGVQTDNLWPSMAVVNIFAPDSLTAAITPLFRSVGSDPWVNHNFVSGDVSINGLTGNASNKYLDSQVDYSILEANNGSSFDIGLSIYDYTVVNGVVTDMGNFVNGGGVGNGSVMLIASQSGQAITELNEAFTVRPSVAAPGNGFFSGNRTANNAEALYFANSGSAFSSIASSSTTTTQTAAAGNAYVFCVNFAGATQFTANTMSFAEMGMGLTSSQAQKLYNRVQTLRTDIGGGYR